MNYQPFHTNIEYADKNQYGKILVVETLVYSLVVDITLPDISGKAFANLFHENIEHLSAIFFNDTITTSTKIFS